ncbi:MAG: hypothetical protein ACC700_20370 [Anaerolineales bacterium]
MIPIYYSGRYVGSKYAFDTTRKAEWIAKSLSASPIDGLELIEPEPLTQEQIVAVHGVNYVDAIKTGEPRHLAKSQGFTWDPGLWPMVLSSNGGAVAAALAALEHGVAGSLSSGLHHARQGSGMGFCTFNGLVIAAHEALAAGAETILIIDVDAHCGGGTASLIADIPDVWQIDLSVDSVDWYESSDRARLYFVREGADYLPTLEQALTDIVRTRIAFDLCLYNAGMDPHENCDVGGLAGITNEILAKREYIVFEWCRRRALPVAFVLAGGYIGARLDKSELVDLHRLTLFASA